MTDEQKGEQRAVAVFQPARLPYHPVLEERFGVDRMGWKTLTEAIFPSAKSVDSIAMALAYCKARNLDIFKRPVHIVPVWSQDQGRMVETVWPGISELRTTAFRTANYAGCDETVFGPDIEDTLGGVKIIYPEWAQCTIYRLISGQRVPIVGPKAYWIETYATAKRDTAAPNAMWKKRPRGQIEKAAEAGALRKAFPEELGNEYSAEEMEGQTFGQGMRDAAPPVSTGLRERLEARKGQTEGFMALATAEAPVEPPEAEYEPVSHDEGTGEVIEPETEEAEPVQGPTPPAEPEPSPFLERVAKFKNVVKAAGTTIKLRAIRDNATDLRKELSEQEPATLEEIDGIWNERFVALEDDEMRAREG